MDTTYKKIKTALNKAEKEGRFNVPDSSPVEIDSDAKLTFAVFGDPQVSSVGPHRSINFKSACSDLANMEKPYDALVIAGDVAEFGREVEYRLTAEILNDVADKFVYFLAVPGNHDIRGRNFSSQLARFNDFVRSVNGGIPAGDEHYWFSREINGYKFIMMGTDKTKIEESYISPEQLSWLDSELEANDKSGKPCFVFNHQTLKLHNGLPNTWQTNDKWRGSVGDQSEKIRRIFLRHKNIFFITGHLHWGTSEYTFQDYGSYKCLSVPAVGATNHGEYSPNSQSFIISVYEDKVVLRSRVFSEGRYAEENVINSNITIIF